MIPLLRFPHAPALRTRKIWTFLCWEAAFAFAYDTWVGSNYLNALAGEVGVSVLWVSLLTSVPWIGAVGQLFTFRFFEKSTSLREYSLYWAAVSRWLWSLPIFFAGALSLKALWGGESFQVLVWFQFTVVIALLSSVFANSSSMAWQSWMRALVRERLRGRFFGERWRYVMGALVVANFLGSYWVGVTWNGWRVGLAVIGILAVIAATISTHLLSKVPDVRPIRAENVTFSETLKNREFRTFLFFSAFFQGAIQIAGPYFAYYFTRDLKIPLSQVVFWILFTNAGAFISSVFWGRWIDASKNPLRVLMVTGGMLGLSPLIYYVFPDSAITHFAPYEYFFNGVAWGGYMVSLSALLFRSVPQEKNTIYFSVQTAAQGLAGAFFAFLGGQLAESLSGGFRSLWFVAFVFRFSVLILGWFYFRSVFHRRVRVGSDL